jgi:hypothetical protein
MKLYLLNLLVLPALAALSTACSDDSGFIGGETEARVVSKSADVILAPSEKKDPIVVFNGDYEIIVSSKNNGAQICQGLFKGTLWSNQKFVPEGTMKCSLKGDIDLAETFPMAISEAMQDYPGYGMVVRELTEDPNTQAVFEPPKPCGLALVQDHEEFKDFAIDQVTQVTFKDGDKELADQGEFHFRVETINETMRIESGETFSKVLSYVLEADGFRGIPRASTGVENRRQTWINTTPVGLLKVKIDSTLPDQFPGLASTLGNLFFGPIEIIIQLKKNIPLEE